MGGRRGGGRKGRISARSGATGADEGKASDAQKLALGLDGEQPRVPLGQPTRRRRRAALPARAVATLRGPHVRVDARLDDVGDAVELLVGEGAVDGAEEAGVGVLDGGAELGERREELAQVEEVGEVRRDARRGVLVDG